MARAAWVDGARDEARLFDHLEVLRSSGLGQRQFLPGVAAVAGLAPPQLPDGDAGRMVRDLDEWLLGVGKGSGR